MAAALRALALLHLLPQLLLASTAPDAACDAGEAAEEAALLQKSSRKDAAGAAGTVARHNVATADPPQQPTPPLDATVEGIPCCKHGNYPFNCLSQLAVDFAADSRTGSGCELGRDLLIASLDQPQLPGEFVEDGKSWAPLPSRRSALLKTAILDEPLERAQTIPRLTVFGRFAQLLPIVVTAALGFEKVRQTISRRTASVSALAVAEAAAALTLYCISGPAVILLNKHIMRTYKFQFPIILASLGNIFLMIVTRAVVALGWKKLEVERVEWDRYLKVVVPINIFNLLSQTLGMYAFLFISVPEIQILKSMTIVIVLLFAWLLVDEKVSQLLIWSVLVIASGVCLSALYDNDSKVGGGSNFTHTLIGVTLMLLASTFEAAKTVISQVLMDKMSLFDGIYHSSPAFVLLAVIFVGAMEAKKLYHYEFNVTVVGLLVINALFTGVIVLSSFWFVKLAGALTLKVVTQARSIGLILCSVLFFGEFCSSPQYIGYTLTLLGMGMFDYVKQARGEVLKGEAAVQQVLKNDSATLAKPQAA